jgi:tetratricopeptide (TPR) repeat protein
MREKPEQESAWYHFGWVGLHVFSGEYAEAIEQARLVDDSTPVLHAHSVNIISAIEAGAKINNPESPTLEEAGLLIEAILEEMPGNASFRSILAMNLARRGQGDAAVQEAKLAVDLTAKDAYDGPNALEDLAEVYTLVGRHDEAIDLLERLLKTVYEGSITLELLKINPVWDPLREHPRYKKLFVAS